MKTSTSKKILLGVCGGIAAYKSAELIRLCRKAQIEVKVIMTHSAQEFIRPLTFSTLSSNKVYTELFQQDLEYNLDHITLARWADVVLIAPATANIIAKLAHGIADDLLSTTCLATASNIPLAIAPAMNQQMWQNSLTQNNIVILKQQGVNIIGPASGEQACGEVGIGRMLEPNEIFIQLKNLLANSNLLNGYKFLITAGPTHENYDSVRYIGNYSSGKMGYALAHAAASAGAAVTLVSGPTHLNCANNINKINVTTAQEMFNAATQHLEENSCNVFIAAAAVADYRPKKSLAQKQKRSANEINLNLERTPDILAHVTSMPKTNRPFTVGFAAETENILENAEQKFRDKNVDMLVANKVGFDEITKTNIGFASDNNELFIFHKNVETKPRPLHFPFASKTILAQKLIQLISNTFLNKHNLSGNDVNL